MMNKSKYMNDEPPFF